MRPKRPFRSLIVCVSCAMVGCILASTAYSRRVDELEIERDIYASRFQNWQMRAIDGVLLMLAVAAVRPVALRQIFSMTTVSPASRRRMYRKPLMRFLC